MARRKSKIHTVMSEYKRGTLKSSSGRKVTNRKQAVAIALSEARRAGGTSHRNKYHRFPSLTMNVVGSAPKDPLDN